MKTHSRLKLFAAVALTVALSSPGFVCGANVTNYDSIVTLATNATKNYTFTDPASGQSVVVAVTMSPYDPANWNATFSSLDGGTRVATDGNAMLNGSGANLSAALVSSSTGVAAGSVKFRIAALGIRPVDGAGSLTWTSSVAGLSITYNSSTEIIQPLDASWASLGGTGYSAQARFPSAAYFQFTDVPAPGQSVVLNASFTVTNNVDPRTNSWFTAYSGMYARIYTSDTNKTNGAAVTTWSRGSTTQASPVYCGVQEIYSSSNWVYIRSSGLANHVMGPWYLDTNHVTPFPNYPTNEHVLYKIPRVPTVPASKTRNNGGAIGYFVDGVAMFNTWDAYTYTNGADTQAGGQGGYWNRDAYVNERASFDNNNAHQAGGQHHYHANPPALRYLLGDHVDFNAVTKAYPESTNTPTRHSPILGWVADGYPVYGPYGYSVSNDASSGVRRMISGYVLRNGQKGSQNLADPTINRASLPQWAVRLYGVSSNIYAGPAVSGSYPLGRYMEDNDYLGDLGYSQGTNTFDLDEYNGRWCVTPEFPGGTYAYFVSIASDGTPVFPYNIGRGYYGNPTGFAPGSISELVITNFLGGPDAAPSLNPLTAGGGAVTLTWSATEGGTYLVESTTNFTAWTTNSTTVPAVLNAASYTNYTLAKYGFYRVAQTSLAAYDSAGTGGGSLVYSTVAPGGTATRGTTVMVTITLPSNPPNPPAGAPITSVTLGGTLTGTAITDNTAGTVTATFAIPSGTTTGLQSISVVFTSGPTYTVTGVTIN